MTAADNFIVRVGELVYGRRPCAFAYDDALRLIEKRFALTDEERAELYALRELKRRVSAAVQGESAE
jgi:hypothetical protein